MIRKITKLNVVKKLNAYLLKNKNRIETVNISFGELTPITMSSTLIESIRTRGEIVTITFRPKKGIARKKI